jgi:hypothetical protein
MDGRQFAAITRSIATEATRRSVLRAVGASAVAVVGAALGRTPAAAQRGKPRRCCVYVCNAGTTGTDFILYRTCTQNACPIAEPGCASSGSFGVTNCSDC